MGHFNSRKVRLTLSAICFAKPSKSIFQFQKGTINTALLYRLPTCLRYFNSRKVRLTPWKPNWYSLVRLYFNSRKVRLTHGGSPHRAGRVLFQFQKGTINTFLLCLCYWFGWNFNSRKVRLTLRGGGAKMCFTLFQFQKGTINTSGGLERMPNFNYFNSRKVRLTPCRSVS